MTRLASDARGTMLLRMAAWMVAAGLLAVPAQAEQDLIGADEYQASCLSCHGVGGRGDGPMAEFLSVEPADLTAIARNNDGVFPMLEVFQVIDGRTDVRGHGIRRGSGWEMPVWGSRYSEEAGAKFGPYGGEMAVRARILELVFYLQAIQQ